MAARLGDHNDSDQSGRMVVDIQGSLQSGSGEGNRERVKRSMRMKVEKERSEHSWRRREDDLRSIGESS